MRLIRIRTPINFKNPDVGGIIFFRHGVLDQNSWLYANSSFYLLLDRRVLSTGFVKYTDADIDYLRKNGEWEDIRLIINLVELSELSGISLLSFTSDEKYRTAAHAIYNMGRTRLAELLSLSMPGQLLAHIITKASDTGFRALGNQTVIKLLPKILNDYLSSNSSRYYNVVHWLDFGIAVPRSRAQQAVGKVIEKAWPS